MIKNITVLDAQGNEYEATYPKRARGLVKSGRARFVDETTICLARPPEQQEETIMTDFNDTEEMLDPREAKVDEAEASFNGDYVEELDANYVADKVNEILADGQLTRDTLMKLTGLSSEAADAAGRMVEARERTNQRLIDLLEKLVDAYKPQPADNKLEAIQSIVQSSDLAENHKFDLMNQLVQKM